MKEYKDDLKETIIAIKSDIKDIKIESINTIHETKEEVSDQIYPLKNEINIQIPIIKQNASELALDAPCEKVLEKNLKKVVYAFSFKQRQMKI